MGSIDERPLGCVFIGPVGVNVPLDILGNSLRSNPFNREPVGQERQRQALAARRNLRLAPLFE